VVRVTPAGTVRGKVSEVNATGGAALMAITRFEAAVATLSAAVRVG
jgi:hypothetical protein